jgi:hypothetical protein
MGVANNLSTPHGSHIIDSILLINYADKRYDLTAVLNKLTIYESMGESPYQHGMLSVTDDNAMHLNLPIIGEEWLEITFRTRLDGGVIGNTQFKKRYKVVSIKNMSKQKVNENQLLLLEFVSEAFWKSECNLFSKSYRGFVTSDLVLDLMQTALEIPVEVEPTLYPRDWIIPNVTAFDFIARLANESTSKENLSSDYKFYENIDGWHFKSLYTLAQADFKQRLNVNIDNRDTYDRLKADEFNKEVHFDLQDQLHGGLGTMIDELDTIQKRVIRSTCGYDQYRAEFPGMNSERIYMNPEIPYPADMFYKLFTGNQAYRTNRDSNMNQRLKRIVNRALMDSSTTTLRIPGNIDLKLGDTVYFDFTFTGKPDHTTAGKYLICSIKHEIAVNNYTMTLNIRKESNIKGEKYEE